MINIAVLGYGTVGSGVVELLDKNRDTIKKNVGEEINVKYILDIRDFENDKYQEKIIKDFNTIINDREISIVAEVIGGATVAYEYTKRLLQSGVNVVTSNKELVATKGAELLKIARDKNVKYLFEASVGGGIPIIHPLLQCLEANNINEIIGIMNGTTNYILTKMKNDNISFDVALKQAQEFGYAERNPDADIKGFDTCRKICILSSLAYEEEIDPDNISVKGIEDLTLEDVKKAEEQGYVVKLVGFSRRTNEGSIEIFVAPCAIEKNNPLANVNDVYNAILVNGDMVGNVMFYGKGAGKFPTASAVCSDIIECVNLKSDRNINLREDRVYIGKPELPMLKGTNFPIVGE